MAHYYTHFSYKNVLWHERTISGSVVITVAKCGNYAVLKHKISFPRREKIIPLRIDRKSVFIKSGSITFLYCYHLKT